jgi:HTH-type transcriptional regulator/antitoxin HipB
LRKKRGLTQAQLGAKLGVAQARIAEIERTPGAISVDQLVRVLSVLGATLVVRNAEAAPPAAPQKGRSTLPQAGVIRANKGSW